MNVVIKIGLWVSTGRVALAKFKVVLSIRNMERNKFMDNSYARLLANLDGVACVENEYNYVVIIENPILFLINYVFIRKFRDLKEQP